MKKNYKIILASFCLLAFIQNSYSQIEIGKIILGGSSDLSFISTSNDGGSSSSFSLDINAGYMFTEQIMGGGILGFGSQSFDGESVSTSRFGAMARYYINSKYYPELSLGVSKFGDASATFFGFGFGYVYVLNDFVSIDPKFSYTINSYEGYSSKDLGIKIGINVYF